MNKYNILVYTMANTGAGLLRLCLLVCASLILAGCVTTTTGGFTPEVSEQEAVEDYIQLAVAYFDADDMTNARRHINNALALDERSSEAHNILALLHQREGDLELADEVFRRAIRFDSTNSRARNNYAAFLFSRQRFSEAYEQLEIVANDTNYEGRAIAFENLGRSALRLGNMEGAANAFVRALQLNGNLYVSALELAQIRYDQEDYLSARQRYNQYLTLKEFYSIPHTPKSLWVGIQVEGHFRNDEVVDGYIRLLTALYQDSTEYTLYQNSVNGN